MSNEQVDGCLRQGVVLVVVVVVVVISLAKC